MKAIEHRKLGYIHLVLIREDNKANVLMNVWGSDPHTNHSELLGTSSVDLLEYHQYGERILQDILFKLDRKCNKRISQIYKKYRFPKFQKDVRFTDNFEFEDITK